MFGLDDILGAPMDLADTVLTGGANKRGMGYFDSARGALEAVNPQTGASAYDSADPATRAAQLDALHEMQQKYQSGGLDAIDRGRVGDIQQGVAQAARTTQAGVGQDAMRRGLYNSGNSLVQQQVAGQGASMVGAQQGRDTAALSEQARLGELGQASGLAGDIRGQDYQKAGALDAIARFNAAQRMRKGEDISGVYTGQAHQSEQDANRSFDEAKSLAKGFGART